MLRQLNDSINTITQLNEYKDAKIDALLKSLDLSNTNGVSIMINKPTKEMRELAIVRHTYVRGDGTIMVPSIAGGTLTSPEMLWTPKTLAEIQELWDPKHE